MACRQVAGQNMLERWSAFLPSTVRFLQSLLTQWQSPLHHDSPMNSSRMPSELHRHLEQVVALWLPQLTLPVSKMLFWQGSSENILFVCIYIRIRTLDIYIYIYIYIYISENLLHKAFCCHLLQLLSLMRWVFGTILRSNLKYLLQKFHFAYQ